MDILTYKREALAQLLLVSTILGAFSLSGLVALLVGPNRDKLHRFLFITLCVASLAFIFATVLDAIMLPATNRQGFRPAAEINGLLYLGDIVIWGVIAGSTAMVVAISGFGFIFSRTLGWLILILSAITFLLFVGCSVFLAHILG